MFKLAPTYQAVQRPRKTGHAGGQRQVGIGQGRADEVRRVRRHVAALVVGVNRQIETHELDKLLVLAVAQLVRKRRRPVEARRRRDVLAAVVRVLVDARRDRWQLRDQVERVVERRDPILVLVHAGAVRLGKLALRLQCTDANAELRHRMHALGKAIDHFRRALGQLGALAQFGRHFSRLRCRWHFACGVSVCVCVCVCMYVCV